ncbi:hypothetical protein DIPPA_23153 [Diplonema papillatum]|nr:hypothetical protein DIPPA_23153 [Diplonema papillatum]
MAIPTRDDLDLSVVKWKDVPVPKADEPDGVKKAMPSEQCVFYPTYTPARSRVADVAGLGNPAACRLD